MTNQPTALELYQSWASGEEKDHAKVLGALLGWVRALEDQIEPLEASKTVARAYLSEVLEIGFAGRHEIPGVGKMMISAPSVTYSYDKKKLTALTDQLRAEGQGEIAAMLDACLIAKSRDGGLVITQSKAVGSDGK